MLFLTFLCLLVSVYANPLNDTTTITIHVGDKLDGHGHYDDADYLFGEAVALIFFIVIIFGCGWGFWALDETSRRTPVATIVGP